MINTKWTKTSSQIVCNEKEAPWTKTAFHYKARFVIVKMFTRTFQNLDLYPIMDHKQLKPINVDYSVRVGYQALRNNMQEYKVYVTMI